MYITLRGRRSGTRVVKQKRQEESVPYENTHPDAYAKCVYSVPCWMIHNDQKYTKRSKALLSMDSRVKIPKSKTMEPLFDDLTTFAIPSNKAAESSVVPPDTKASPRLPVPVMAIREGTVPPGA